MLRITITLSNKHFQLSCTEESKPVLEAMVKKLDDAIEITRNNNPHASFELALVIAALRLMDDKHSKSTREDIVLLEKENSELKELLSLVFSALEGIATKIEKI